MQEAVNNMVDTVRSSYSHGCKDLNIKEYDHETKKKCKFYDPKSFSMPQEISYNPEKEDLDVLISSLSRLPLSLKLELVSELQKINQYSASLIKV